MRCVGGLSVLGNSVEAFEDVGDRKAGITAFRVRTGKLDGFTLSVDGGAFREYSFGTLGGHPVSFNAPLVGHTFTFGYARAKSPEDFYLAGLNVTAVAPPVPEASTSAMMALGLCALGAVAARRPRG